jgi:periplasmic divalent cation tolerance protein
MKKFSLIYITTQSKKEAKRIAKILLKEKLIACANIFPIESQFLWQGKIKKVKEFGMILKTKRRLVEKIVKKIKAIHSYKIPCIISFSIEKGNKDFLDWIGDSTK